METEKINHKIDFKLYPSEEHKYKIYYKPRKNNNEINHRFNEQNEPKFKTFGTQTFEENLSNNSNIKNNKKRKIKLKFINKAKIIKKNLLNNIKSFCDDFYDSNKENNNYRNKLREDIVKNIDNYIFSELNKNILFPKFHRENFKKKININCFLNNKNKNKKENKIKKEKKLRSFDSDIVSKKNIFLTNFSEDSKSKNKKEKLCKYKFEDYAKNTVKYNHPQIYTLINRNKNKNIFPKIKPKKTLNQFLDIAKLIPEIKTNKTNYNKQMYEAYQTMNIKNKNRIHIHT